MIDKFADAATLGLLIGAVLAVVVMVVAYVRMKKQKES
jgi:uncharacterized protein (UPF0333 family)